METTSTGAPNAVDPPLVGTDTRWLRLERPGLRERLNKDGAWLFLALLALGLSSAMPFLKSKGLWISIPCWFNKVTGLPCLTCGLTRSLSLCAHREWYAASQMHLLGPPIFVLGCGYVIYVLASMAGGFRLKILLSRRARGIAFWSVLGVFCVYWVIKLVFMRGTW
ncbi:MAG: DUF2752 domain-containing protein [Actinomycetia bacterium]|nr:DUF2752 domain-containing protein [Actinomycetota bacterium]MCG2796621.1 DUF2752 domain-containing protein [Actinomycetes bacterium]MBU4301143.1 DUF2752 domain-containing protein [Actinomycetota bacterium]MBU4392531.1 DUF2752 domain-containing protein [Actinomycetota bacterium]MBU4401583.1 DUF2752 domain-containing protein [Actinomycetota bacterium]